MVNRDEMNMINQAEELKARTKKFAIRIIKTSRSLPRTMEGRVLGTQLLKSATLLAANYRASCRARSRAEFLAKLGIVVEEADETIFWLELLLESGLFNKEQVNGLLDEANQLLAIFAASQRTVKAKKS